MVDENIMYSLVMYNLSGIQKGIQSQHSALEYAHKYGNTDAYKDYFNVKTVKLLDGGPSGKQLENVEFLKELEWDYADFYEPDLNDACSSISFLIPRRIYTAEKTPSSGSWKYPSTEKSNIFKILDDRSAKMAAFISEFRLAKN